MTNENKTNDIARRLFESGAIDNHEFKQLVTSTSTDEQHRKSHTVGSRVSINSEIDLDAFGADDAGNADAFVKIMPNEYLHTTSRGWFKWNNKYWQNRDAEPALKRDVEAVLRRRQFFTGNEKIFAAARPTNGKINACAEILKYKLAAGVEQFDTHADRITAPNGVINMRTGELMPHDKTLMLTTCVNAEYDQTTDTALITEFLNEVVKGGSDVVNWLQQALGYFATGEKHIEKALYIWGAARAGKGTLSEALQHLLGELAQTINFSSLVERREPDTNNFDLAAYITAHTVVADESDRRDKLNAGKIKSITGGGAIRCAFKGKDSFQYQPKFKIAMISNHAPNADPADDAVWSRLWVVEFPNSHAGTEDTTIKLRFKTESYQKALLNWLVRGAMAMYQSPNGRIDEPPTVKQSTSEARSALDTVQQWLEACCKCGGDDRFASSDAVYRSYSQWSEANGYEPKNLRNLMLSLKAKKFRTSVQRWVNNTSLRGVEGLTIL